jgi:hypothetical protein
MKVPVLPRLAPRLPAQTVVPETLCVVTMGPAWRKTPFADILPHVARKSFVVLHAVPVVLIAGLSVPPRDISAATRTQVFYAKVQTHAAANSVVRGEPIIVATERAVKKVLCVAMDNVVHRTQSVVGITAV